MSSSSTPIDRFGAYLAQARRREISRHLLRFLALLCVCLVVITALGAWAGLFRGFTPGLTNAFRAALLVAAFALFVFLLWKPLKALKRDKGAALVENADASFDGRVHTFLDTKSADPQQPFLSLLARDALSVARRVPLDRIVPTAAIVWPLLLLLTMLVAVFSANHFAPHQWKNAALHVWWGWQDDSLVEPRVVAVAPGHIELLAGEDLDLEIELSGFVQDEVTLHARGAGDESWQTTSISQSPDQRFRFTLFRVNEPLEYYINAAFTQSETYQVSVIQPAKLQGIAADYEYPEWTRLEPSSDDDVGDISGVKNTLVSLTFSLDKPLQDGALRFDDQLVALTRISDGEGASSSATAQYQATFVILNDTQYQLVDRMLCLLYTSPSPRDS